MTAAHGKRPVDRPSSRDRRERDNGQLLAAFLQRHPEFGFDVQEYIISHRFTAELQQRYQAFVRCMSGRARLANDHRLWRAVKAGATDWVPAYQDYDRAERFSAWPPIDKRRLRQAPASFVAANYPSDDLFLKNTTGSSGTPVPIWHSAEFYFDGLLLALPKAAFLLGQTAGFKRPFFCLAVSDDRAKQEFVTLDPTGRTGISLRVVVDEKEPATFDRVWALMNELQPACISSKPSILEALAARVGRGGRRIAPPAFVISSGARLEKPVRRSLGRALRTTVTEAYGLTEFGVVAYPCPRGRLHVDTSAVHLEILAEDGEPLAAGRVGEIVLSSLANPAMPLLRYRTGDLGALRPSRCACGCPAPVLEKLSGRIIRCFRLPSGRLFTPTYFNDLFGRYPFLQEFQLTQQSSRGYELRLELLDAVKAPAIKLAAVRSYVERCIPERPEVKVARTTFQRDGKFERFRLSI